MSEIDLREALKGELEKGMAEHIPFIPVASKDWLLEAIERGQVKTATIEKDKQPMYLICYTIGLNSMLYVDFAAQLGVVGDSSALFAGAELLAKSCKCSRVAFHTRRGGLNVKATSAGYHPEALLYVKLI